MTLKCNIPLSKFQQMLSSAEVENPRFNISQFEKYYYPDSGIWWCMLVDGIRCLAAAAMMEDGPKSGWWYLNEIQCLVKGFGSKMLKALLKHYKNVWLMADPTANSTLIDYYRRPEFNLEEHVVPARLSIYDVDTHIFSAKGLPEETWQQWLEYRFGNQKRQLEQLDEDIGDRSIDYFGAMFDIVVRAYYSKFGINLYYMKFLVDQQPVYTNGEPCYEYDVDECAGDWTSLGWIRLNPDMESVMDKYGITWHGSNDVNEFTKLIIAHELAHEVWNNIADDEFKRNILDEARKCSFNTVYLDNVRHNKLEEETFCEYLAHKIVKQRKKIDFPEEEVEDLSKRKHIVTHRVSDDALLFNVGDIVDAPWGIPYVVAKKVVVNDIYDSPYAGQLSQEQLEYLKQFNNIVILDLNAQYEPPYTLQQIKEKYPEVVYLKLANDPVHRWRAETGIELIHKEPTEEELDRIWENWQLMTDEMKEESDIKSLELFGCTNEQHYNFLKTEEY